MAHVPFFFAQLVNVAFGMGIFHSQHTLQGRDRDCIKIQGCFHVISEYMACS